MAFQKIKGTQDFYGTKAKLKSYVTETAKEVCYKYNIDEITTPIFENTNVFSRGLLLSERH